MLGFGVGEAIMAASAFKSAVDAIKSGIGTAKSVRDIASSIDQLLDSKSKLDRAKNKKAAPGQFSISSIASETIDAKLAEEELYSIKLAINNRFGFGTFEAIEQERKKRIKDFADAQRKQAAAKAKRRKELLNDLKILLWIVGGSVVAGVALVIYFTYAN
ncbi:MAG: hypothetical protein CBC02_001395 [Flavobacteriaceae bacterium TMED42]|nr:MAG: hypothetical protein CBC02_001395 [Flavobacteriaceae bacterium TMED42]